MSDARDRLLVVVVQGLATDDLAPQYMPFLTTRGDGIPCALDVEPAAPRDVVDQLLDAMEVPGLREAGVDVDRRLLRVGMPKQAFGYAATNELMGLKDPPTAIFIGNNLLTIGALRALHERGLSPGVDVALAVFDEMDWMAVLDVPLLVAAQPTYAMGRMAAELLFARMDDAARPAQDVVIAATIHDGAAARPVANGLPVALRAVAGVPLPR